MLMLAPLAPHVAEELWRAARPRPRRSPTTPFPVADPALLVDDTVEYPVQVNGKVRAASTVAADAADDAVEAAALADDKVLAALGGSGRRRSSWSPAAWSTSSSDLRRSGAVRPLTDGPLTWAVRRLSVPHLSRSRSHLPTTRVARCGRTRGHEGEQHEWATASDDNAERTGSHPVPT